MTPKIENCLCPKCKFHLQVASTSTILEYYLYSIQIVQIASPPVASPSNDVCRNKDKISLLHIHNRNECRIQYNSYENILLIFQ